MKTKAKYKSLKLTKKDLNPIKTLLKSGESFKTIAEVFHVSGPTLKKFMIENDLYQYSTNSKSIKLAQNQLKTNSIITFGDISNLNRIIANNNRIYNEDIKVLEELLKNGNTITDIAKIYKCDRHPVRNILKDNGLYQKYYDSNNRLKSIYNKKPINKDILNNKVDIKIENEPEKKVTNNITNELQFLKNDSINDIVLDYINKNIGKIALEAKIVDLTNCMIDKIVDNFSDEELKDKEIISSIKQCLIKSIDDLLL